MKTDASGSYEVMLHSDYYRYIAYCDYPSTPGFDYVPSCGMFFLNTSGQLFNVYKESINKTASNFCLELLPGASVMIGVPDQCFAGSLVRLQHESLWPLEEFSPPGWRSIAWTLYGRYGPEIGWYTISRDLNLSERVAVVPSGLPVWVNVSVHSPVLREPLSINLRIPENESEYLNLAQGDLFAVDLRKRVLQSYADAQHLHLRAAQATLDRAMKMGFYTFYEGVRLSKCENQLISAQSLTAVGEYDGAFAALCEAYLILEDIEKALLDMFTNASQSV